jgi:chromosome segregation ATPase
MKRFAAALCVLVLSACGPSVSVTVKRESLLALPVESRIDLLEAENELFGAVDELDDAEQALEDAREALRRANRRVGEAEDNRDKASNSKDPKNREIGVLAVQEAKLRRDFQETAVDQADVQLEVVQARLLVAQARFERTKAEAVKKANTKGASDIKLKDFDEQIVRLESRVKSMKAELTKGQAAEDKARKAWATASRKLADLTGGAQGSVWVE